MIATALSVFIAAASGAAAAPVHYEFNVSFEQMEDEVKRGREIRVTCHPIQKGKSSFGLGKEGEEPGLTMDVDIRAKTREIDARFTLCRPGVTPCNVIARPRLIFGFGEPASFSGSTDDGLVYSAAFSPCTPEEKE